MATKKTVKLVADLRAMDAGTIAQKTTEFRQELAKHHQANAAGELPSVAVIRASRRNIAKTLTILSEKQRALAESSAEAAKEIK